jgi:hypothetical protein
MMKKLFGIAATAALAFVVMNASPVVKMNSVLGVSLGGQALAADMAPPPPPPVVAPVGKGKAPYWGKGKGKAPPPIVTKG